MWNSISVRRQINLSSLGSFDSSWQQFLWIHIHSLTPMYSVNLNEFNDVSKISCKMALFNVIDGQTLLLSHNGINVVESCFIDKLLKDNSMSFKMFFYKKHSHLRIYNTRYHKIDSRFLQEENTDICNCMKTLIKHWGTHVYIIIHPVYTYQHLFQSHCKASLLTKAVLSLQKNGSRQNW